MRKYLLGGVAGAVAMLLALAASDYRRQAREQMINTED